MTARFARTVASLTAAAFVAACTSFYEIPIETPIKAKLDTAAFQRVLVAGFLAGGTDDVDGNLETTRLLRSQLRTKSELRVIDTDVLPLMEAAADTNKGGTSAPLPNPIKEAKDLEPYEHIFGDVEYWKRIGEEYQQPLIVTGTVMFTPQQRSQMQQREQEEYDTLGRRRVVAERRLVERKGFGIAGRFIFIDGRTGTVLHSQRFIEQVLYDANRQTPALSSYFELMDKLIPSFLATLSSQRVKGTRILLL